jgi:hypothetical protein
MNGILRFALLYAYIVLLSFPSQANNIMASDIRWQCVGKDSFLVTLIVYRDCNGDALMPIDLHLECHNTGTALSVLKFTPGTPVDVTPVCNVSCTRCQDPQCSFPYGIHRYTMHRIVNLSNAEGCCRIHLWWEKCCRNLSITTGAAGKNFYTEAILDRCTVPCDNSPHMNYTLPVGILCAGFEYQFHMDPEDVDIDSFGLLLDSFAIEFAPPLQAVSDSITYDTPYSSTKPIYFDGFPNNKLDFPKGFRIIDHGILQFKPMKPEITVFAIMVKEFRKGKLIGEIRREMQYMVIICPKNHQPIVFTPNNVRHKSITEGETVFFNFSSHDSDLNDSLTISWNNAIPGAIWAHCNGQSKHPTGCLSWTPHDIIKENKAYIFTFAVTVRDDAQPVRGFFTQAYQITVKPHPEAKLYISDSCNGLFYFNAKLIKGSGPVFSWIGNSFVFSPRYGPVTSHMFQPGIYPFYMTMVASGGSCTILDTLVYFPIKATLPDDTAVCKNAKLNLKLNLDPYPYNFFVEWSSGNHIFRTDSIIDFPITITSDTSIIANVYTSPSCWVSSDTIHIKLLNCTSINDQHVQEYIRMSPNPATDQVNLSTVLPGMKFQTISVYNNLGKLSQQFDNIGSDRITIYRINDTVGVYFVKISLINGEVINTKLLWR